MQQYHSIILRAQLVTLMAFGSLPLRAQDLLNGFIQEDSGLTHLEFSGASNWSYTVQRKGQSKEFMVRVPALSNESLDKFRLFTGPFIEKIEVRPEGLDGKTELVFTLKKEGLDVFDYLTEEPSRLIVDIFPREAPKVQTETETPKIESGVQKTASLPKKGASRRGPASEEFVAVGPLAEPSELPYVPPQLLGVYDGGDPEFRRFIVKPYEIKESSIAKSKQNLYLNFPLIDFQNSDLAEMEASPPRYEIEAEDSKENKEARLLLTLFQNKRYAVFFKTLGIFLDKYPQSKFKEMLKYLEADIMYAMWKTDKRLDFFDKAMGLYRDLLKTYPKSQLALRTKRLVTDALLDRGDYLGTLRYAEEYTQTHKEDPSVGKVNLSKAQAFVQLHRYDEAFAILDAIEKSSAPEGVRAEAAYLKGNVFSKKGDLNQAVLEYRSALKNFPKFKTVFPYALYNQGEALFWLKRPAEALDVLREYVQLFNDPKFCGFAMTRMGEALEIMGADREKSMGALKESTFRYKNSPGAQIAEMKLLAGQMKNMKDKEVANTIEELKKKQGSLKVDRIDQFITFTIADGYFDRGDPQNAADTLIDFFQNHPQMENKEIFQEKISRFISEQIRNFVIEKKPFLALKTYKRYKDTWLKNNKRTDTDYFVGLAFEHAGAPTKAAEYYDSVLKDYQRLEKIPQLLQEKKFTEHLPTLNQIRLRQAAVSKEVGDFSETAKYLDLLKNRDQMSGEERVEEGLLAAQVEDEKGNTEKALQHCRQILKDWANQPELLPRVYVHMARLYQKKKDNAEALSAYETVVTSLRGDRASLKTSYEELAKLYTKSKDYPRALKALESYIKEFSDKEDVSWAQYQQANLYFEDKKFQKAKDLWQDLASKDSVWARLSKDRLKEADWSKDYQRYVDRIPAMSNKSGAKKENL